jgi:hypothetical protein
VEVYESLYYHIKCATRSIGESPEEFVIDDSSDFFTGRPADVLLAATEDVPTMKPFSDDDHDEARLDSAKETQYSTVGMYAEDHNVENVSALQPLGTD